MTLVLAKGTRILVRHGEGEALASVQRFVDSRTTMVVRKWRKAKQRWSSPITVPIADFIRVAPYSMYMDCEQDPSDDTN